MVECFFNVLQHFNIFIVCHHNVYARISSQSFSKLIFSHHCEAIKHMTPIRPLWSNEDDAGNT